LSFLTPGKSSWSTVEFIAPNMRKPSPRGKPESQNCEWANLCRSPALRNGGSPFARLTGSRRVWSRGQPHAGAGATAGVYSRMTAPSRCFKLLDEALMRRVGLGIGQASLAAAIGKSVGHALWPAGTFPPRNTSNSSTDSRCAGLACLTTCRIASCVVCFRHHHGHVAANGRIRRQRLERPRRDAAHQHLVQVQLRQQNRVPEIIFSPSIGCSCPSSPI
jgi:hypothetical protein